MKKLLLILLCVPLIGLGQYVNWDNRIAYEPSRKNSYKEYYNQSLLIFSSLDHLNNYRNQGTLDSNKLIYNHKFKKFPDSNTYKLTEQFYFPLIKSVDKDIKVVGVILPVPDLSYLDNLLFPPPPEIHNSSENTDDVINSYDLFKDSTDLIQGHLCIDCNIYGINDFKPVILLNKNELDYLRKSLVKMIHSNGSLNDMKRYFEASLILIHKSILGQIKSTDSIENLTFDEFWKIYFGINYFDPNFGKLKFKDISSIKKKHFLNFYNEFSSQAEDFIETSYIPSNPYKNRRFFVAGSYWYWIPLEDFPGCNFIK